MVPLGAKAESSTSANQATQIKAKTRVSTARVVKKYSNVKLIDTSKGMARAFSLKSRAMTFTSLKLQKNVKLTKTDFKQGWFRDQYADLNVNGKRMRFYHVTNSAKSFWIRPCDLQSVNSSSFHPTGQHTQAYNGRIAFLGDSIPAGWDGTRLNHGNSYVDWFAQYIRMSRKHMHNYAVPDAKIVGDRYHTFQNGTLHGQDLKAQVQQHKAELKKVNYIYIALGTNDYTKGSGSGSLTHVASTLEHYVKYLKRLNPNAHIVGILPLTRFNMITSADSSNVTNDEGYTLRQEREALRKVYHQTGAKVVNFHYLAPNLITASNRLATLNDGFLHPTVQTDQKLGKLLAGTFAK